MRIAILAGVACLGCVTPAEHRYEDILARTDAASDKLVRAIETGNKDAENAARVELGSLRDERGVVIEEIAVQVEARQTRQSRAWGVIGSVLGWLVTTGIGALVGRKPT